MMESSPRSKSRIDRAAEFDSATSANGLHKHPDTDERFAGLWLSPDLAKRTRPAGWDRSEKELAWLRNREEKVLGHHYLNLADSALAPRAARRKRIA
jgi:hypothetical protein